MQTGLSQGQILPLLASSVLLLMERSSGLNWLAVGIIVIFIVSVFNIWVLLVEILR
ncbi:MAG: hypothetical protein WDO06_02875 [Actinomycetota bacterium]